MNEDHVGRRRDPSVLLDPAAVEALEAVEEHGGHHHALPIVSQLGTMTEAPFGDEAQDTRREAPCHDGEGVDLDERLGCKRRRRPELAGR